MWSIGNGFTGLSLYVHKDLRWPYRPAAFAAHAAAAIDPPTVYWNGFYADISWETKLNEGSTKMFKFLNQCFAWLRFWKSVSSKTAVAPSSRFRESETLFQNRSCAKHWFKNLNILVADLYSQYCAIFVHTSMYTGSCSFSHVQWLGTKMKAKKKFFLRGIAFRWIIPTEISLQSRDRVLLTI